MDDVVVVRDDDQLKRLEATEGAGEGAGDGSFFSGIDLGVGGSSLSDWLILATSQSNKLLYNNIENES